MNLAKKKCIPCEDKSMKPFSKKEAKEYLSFLEDWKLDAKAKMITRTWLLKDFVTVMKFVNKIAVLAEREGHHPDLSISYNKLTVVLWTHSIKGLSENDFIVAAKINALK